MVMLYVPQGEFEMGTNEGFSHEQPVHTVALDGFWIDRTEVTNAQYSLCVQTGECTPPLLSSSLTRDSYYGDSDYDDYPVIWASWHDAVDYCSWAGARLPTEAEWEYAARGPEGLDYPWGDRAPDDSLANFSSNVGDTMKVGAYPNGASWCGALDMTGNVWEWIADWYAEDYYEGSPSQNPSGPPSGEDRVGRGGSCCMSVADAYLLRGASRFWSYPLHRYHHAGFRCARDAVNRVL
jgi:formylglycine-generating enzyme required for sulfatase activity